MNGLMTRLPCAALASAFLFSSLASAGPMANGQISGLNFTYRFGTNAPGLDQFDALGTYVLGSGSNGLSLPGDAVVLSFNGGSFIQAIPSNSFSAISGGWRYLSTNPGISEIKIMNNGALTIRVRKADFTNVNPTAFGPISLTVGDDVFTAIPNSVPVAKIVGPVAAAVGSTVVLDATQSTDFNSNTLAHSWVLVSEPLGSNVTLSSTTSPSVNFVPTKNGSYTIRLTNNDGISDGVLALITVVASGGAVDPAPGPMPNNGVVTLSVGAPSYLAGESAVINLHEDAQPGNGTSRWYFRSFYQGNPISFTPVPNSLDNTYSTPPLTPGDKTVLVESFLENINLAKALLDSINDYNAQIVAINAALANETNAEIISQLQAQKAFYMEQIAISQEQLEFNRTKVGETVQVSFSVAE